MPFPHHCRRQSIDLVGSEPRPDERVSGDFEAIERLTAAEFVIGDVVVEAAIDRVGAGLALGIERGEPVPRLRLGVIEDALAICFQHVVSGTQRCLTPTFAVDQPCEPHAALWSFAYPSANPRAMAPNIRISSRAAWRVQNGCPVSRCGRCEPSTESALPKIFPKTWGRTEADPQGRMHTKLLNNMRCVLSTTVRRCAFYPTFTAVTGVRIPLGTPKISIIKMVRPTLIPLKVMRSEATEATAANASPKPSISITRR
jgi:hypothetical protein